MKKILLYSDCFMFGGSENMMSIFLNSETFNNEFEIDFAYRYTERYQKGFEAQVKKMDNCYPLELIDSYELIEKKFAPKSKIVRNIFWVLFIPILRKICIARNTKTIQAFMKNRSYDLLYVNNGGYPGGESSYSAIFAAKKLGINKIVYMSNCIAQGYTVPLRIFDFFRDRKIRKYVTYFVTASKSAKQSLVKVLKIVPEKIINIYNGIKLQPLSISKEDFRKQYGFDNEDFLVTIIANLEKRKGIPYALEAMEKINNPKIKLLLRGDGTLKNTIEEIIQKSTKKNIFIIPRQNVVGDLINASDIILLPSVGFEDLPNTISESMGYGKVVLSTRVAGIPEQIDDRKTGFLIEKESSESIKNAIIYCYEHKDLMQEMEMNAKQKFNSHFESNVSVNQYVKFLNMVLNGEEIENPSMFTENL